jgi:hypothetical protein
VPLALINGESQLATERIADFVQVILIDRNQKVELREDRLNADPPVDRRFWDRNASLPATPCNEFHFAGIRN